MRSVAVVDSLTTLVQKDPLSGLAEVCFPFLNFLGIGMTKMLPPE